MEPRRGWDTSASGAPSRTAWASAGSGAAYEARYPDGVRELEPLRLLALPLGSGDGRAPLPRGNGDPGWSRGPPWWFRCTTTARKAPGERDAGTRMDFQVAETVERPALHLAQTRGPWLAGERNGSMVIPPGRR
jgi:hypothetical protein